LLAQQLLLQLLDLLRDDLYPLLQLLDLLLLHVVQLLQLL
jgi:hypothetical protein